MTAALQQKQAVQFLGKFGSWKADARLVFPEYPSPNGLLYGSGTEFVRLNVAHINWSSADAMQIWVTDPVDASRSIRLQRDHGLVQFGALFYRMDRAAVDLSAVTVVPAPYDRHAVHLCRVADGLTLYVSRGALDDLGSYKLFIGHLNKAGETRLSEIVVTGRQSYPQDGLLLVTAMGSACSKSFFVPPVSMQTAGTPVQWGSQLVQSLDPAQFHIVEWGSTATVTSK